MSRSRTVPIDVRTRLAAGAISALLLKGTSIAITIVLQAVLARLLPPSEYGTFVLGLSVAGMAITVGSIGLRQGTVILISRHTNPDRHPGLPGLLHVAALALLGNGAVGVGMWLFGGPVLEALFADATLITILAPLALFVVLTGVQVVIAESFRAVRNIGMASLLATQYSGGAVLSTAMLLAAILTLWGLHAVTLEATWWASAAAALLTVGIGIVIAALPSRPKEQVARPNSPASQSSSDRVTGSRAVDAGVSSTIRVLAPLWATNLMLFALSQAGLWLLGNQYAGEEVALYGAAARLVTLVATPLLVANAVLPGFITQLHRTGDMAALERTLRRTSTIAALPALAVLVFMLMFARPILGLIYGEFYMRAAPVLTVLAAGQAVNVWSGSSGLTLMLTDNRVAMLIVTVVGSLLTVALAVALVGPYGAVGAAVATAAGLLVQNLAAVIAAKRRLGIWTQMYAWSGIRHAWRNTP